MKNRRRLLFVTRFALLFLSTVVIAPHLIGKEKAESTNELAVAKGKIISYSFLDDSRGIHQYTIRLSGYPATFQIPSDFAKYFAKDRFQSNLKKGDSLSVSILAQSAGSLTSTGPIPIFAARTDTATYLDEHFTLGGHDDELNNNASKANSKQASNGKHFPALTLFEFLLIGLVLVAFFMAFIIRKPKAKNIPAPPAALIEQSSQRLKRYVPKRNSEQKSPELQKPTEPPPICPVCGAPAEKGYLYGADFTSQQRTAGNGIASASVTGEIGGTDGLPPYAEALRCSSCKRITLGARANKALLT